MINGFGEKMKIAREILNMNQTDLAKKIGISASAIGMYEQGRREPSLELLSKLCSVLNLSADYLLNIEKQKTSPDESAGLNQKELLLLKKYRTLGPDKQNAINTLIGIENTTIEEDIVQTLKDNKAVPTNVK